MRVLACVAILSALCPAQQTPPSDSMDAWGSWSRDAIKRWQIAGVLHGNDLPKCRDFAAKIETNWKRIDRADKVDELLTDAARTRFETMIRNLINGVRQKKARRDAQLLLDDIQARYTAFIAEKKIEDAIAKDLDALRVVMNANVSAWKPPEPKEPKPESRSKPAARKPAAKDEAKKPFQDDVGQIERLAATWKKAAEWESDFADTMIEAISSLKDYIETLQ